MHSGAVVFGQTDVCTTDIGPLVWNFARGRIEISGSSVSAYKDNPILIKERWCIFVTK